MDTKLTISKTALAMTVFLRRLFVKSNGSPRAWLKKCFFDDSLLVKNEWKFVLFKRDGRVRDLFFKWYRGVLENPSPSRDPKWRQTRIETLKRLPAARGSSFSIISPLATLYVARMLQYNLSTWGLSAPILAEPPDEFDADFYIVICPQVFERLPPREKRIAFQMEQSVTTRWFTDEYLDILYNSLAVFDYSKKNIEYLERLRPGLNNLYYVPIEVMPLRQLIGADGDSARDDSGYEYDLVFYGDPKARRRKKFLKALGKKYKVLILKGIYGPDLWRQLRRARLVVNIHYYEDALLETTRIMECVTLGVLVVSESASDQSDHEGLEEKVVFTQADDVQAMIDAVGGLLLAHPNGRPPVPRDSGLVGTHLRTALESFVRF